MSAPSLKPGSAVLGVLALVGALGAVLVAAFAFEPSRLTYEGKHACGTVARNLSWWVFERQTQAWLNRVRFEQVCEGERVCWRHLTADQMIDYMVDRSRHMKMLRDSPASEEQP